MNEGRKRYGQLCHKWCLQLNHSCKCDILKLLLIVLITYKLSVTTVCGVIYQPLSHKTDGGRCLKWDNSKMETFNITRFCQTDGWSIIDSAEPISGPIFGLHLLLQCDCASFNQILLKLADYPPHCVFC